MHIIYSSCNWPPFPLRLQRQHQRRGESRRMASRLSSLWRYAWRSSETNLWGESHGFRMVMDGYGWFRVAIQLLYIVVLSDLAKSVNAKHSCCRVAKCHVASFLCYWCTIQDQPRAQGVLLFSCSDSLGEASTRCDHFQLFVELLRSGLAVPQPNWLIKLIGKGKDGKPNRYD